MSNPRPCVCGHPRSDHALPLSATVVSGYCRPCFMALDTGGTICRIYRKALRKEPLVAPCRPLCVPGHRTVVPWPNDGLDDE